jgi:hypothetical protein
MIICVLDPDKKYKAHLNYTNASGAPAKVDGKPTITEDANGKSTLTQPTEDGLDIKLQPLAGIVDGEESNYDITADADLGSGVKPLPEHIRVLWSREAVNLSVVFEVDTEAA